MSVLDVTPACERDQSHVTNDPPETMATVCVVSVTKGQLVKLLLSCLLRPLFVLLLCGQIPPVNATMMVMTMMMMMMMMIATM